MRLCESCQQLKQSKVWKQTSETESQSLLVDIRMDLGDDKSTRIVTSFTKNAMGYTKKNEKSQLRATSHQQLLYVLEIRSEYEKKLEM